ncbi:MBL fold metallo-hydrolase [Halorhodospira halophila]|uniref:Cyclic-AMP phosphodiesterase n=1 Tax=Halorhodospira halophila (strain DSM 244 / SL1) TaxID=349124 RepID=A1WTT0_HALHL|nr:3',5'-cyclic-nucleotide phosphodiesterase [Halorhodospira halophila]ABM61092.1 cyclic-AMP phosphodiesterase [Halorhodospira halophila SL1]MBK1729809.1 3',5'-cyclic-nucleotide phosphodiesterase [Halorhodospira halophila]
MELRALGTSGGIGQGLRTTALLVDGWLLVDAGSGVGDLTAAELGGIRDVLLTHAHLDHIAYLGLMADARIGDDSPPIRVHAPAPTLDALRAHLFNGVLWPDFTAIPTREEPVLTLHPLAPDQAVPIGALHVTPLPAQHAVPAVGYRIEDGHACFVFTGDTGPCPTFWQRLLEAEPPDALIIECAFPDALRSLALQVGHFTPGLLIDQLRQLPSGVQVWVSHLKPSAAARIEQELREQAAAARVAIELLGSGDQLRL